MGFYLERYNNNACGLVVSFANKSNSSTFFNSDSIKEAMEYFGIYLDKGNQLRIKTEDSQALDTLNINAKEAIELRASIDTLLGALDDKTADTNKLLFPLWSGDGVVYSVGTRIRYDGTLYKVLQAHTSQSDWTPDAAVSLFSRCIEVSTDEEGNVSNDVPEWVQPDSTNVYNKGDKVMFEEQVYESLIDNNVWSPTAYPQGWSLITEE